MNMGGVDIAHRRAGGEGMRLAVPRGTLFEGCLMLTDDLVKKLIHRVKVHVA